MLLKRHWIFRAMKKSIVKDHFFLQQKSTDVTKDDLFIIHDLLDTIQAYQDQCVGMAANMIGYLKRMIVVFDGKDYLILINPQMIKYTGQQYITEECCLSHQGTKQTKRYPKIKVSYLDEKMKKKIKTFEGLTAQIIQHEMDHLEGILI